MTVTSRKKSARRSEFLTKMVMASFQFQVRVQKRKSTIAVAFFSDLQHVLQTLGEKLSPDETQVKYDAADKDANCDLIFFYLFISIYRDMNISRTVGGSEIGPKREEIIKLEVS